MKQRNWLKQIKMTEIFVNFNFNRIFCHFNNFGGDFLKMVFPMQKCMFFYPNLKKVSIDMVMIEYVFKYRAKGHIPVPTTW